MTADQINAEAMHFLDRALGFGAGVLEEELRATLGVQATVTLSRGRLRATTPATPGAAPRRVTGNLGDHVAIGHPAEGVWEVGVTVPVAYARRLGDIGHVYMEPAIARALPRIEAAVAQVGTGPVVGVEVR